MFHIFANGDIETCLKADDAQYCQDAITSANESNEYEKLILSLQMARSKVRDKAVNSELIYAYAKVGTSITFI